MYVNGDGSVKAAGQAILKQFGELES